MKKIKESIKELIKNKLWAVVGAAWLVTVLLCVLVLPSPLRWIIAAVLTAAAALVLLAERLNRHCIAVFKKMAPTSYFSDLRFRNMKAIAVGSTAAWQYLDADADKCYNALGFSRSNSMCFNMLKTYFSHVGDGGEVFYIVDPQESDRIGDYISPCDFLHIHRLLFMYLGKSTTAEARNCPLRHDFSFSVRCAAAMFRKEKGLLPGTWKRSGSRSTVISDSLKSELEEIREFCEERELGFNLILINRSADTGAETAAAARKVLGWDRKIPVTVVSDRGELNDAVRC